MSASISRWASSRARPVRASGNPSAAPPPLPVVSSGMSSVGVRMRAAPLPAEAGDADGAVRLAGVGYLGPGDGGGQDPVAVDPHRLGRADELQELGLGGVAPRLRRALRLAGRRLGVGGRT